MDWSNDDRPWTRPQSFKGLQHNGLWTSQYLQMDLREGRVHFDVHFNVHGHTCADVSNLTSISTSTEEASVDMSADIYGKAQKRVWTFSLFMGVQMCPLLSNNSACTCMLNA